MTTRRSRSRTVALASVLGVSLLVSCSSDDTAGDATTTTADETTTTAPTTSESTTGESSTTTAPAAVATTEVSIEDYAFGPPVIEVSVGDTVTWTNLDDFKHTTTSDEGLWDSGPIDPSATFSHTFDAAGTFAYFCNIHNYMEGEVVVE